MCVHEIGAKARINLRDRAKRFSAVSLCTLLLYSFILSSMALAVNITYLVIRSIFFSRETRDTFRWTYVALMVYTTKMFRWLFLSFSFLFRFISTLSFFVFWGFHFRFNVHFSFTSMLERLHIYSSMNRAFPTPQVPLHATSSSRRTIYSSFPYVGIWGIIYLDIVCFVWKRAISLDSLEIH